MSRVLLCHNTMPGSHSHNTMPGSQVMVGCTRRLRLRTTASLQSLWCSRAAMEVEACQLEGQP